MKRFEKSVKGKLLMTLKSDNPNTVGYDSKPCNPLELSNSLG